MGTIPDSRSPFRKDTILYIAAWFLMQFCFLGIYSVLINLYLIRLGYGTRFIGTVNGVIGIGFAAACFPAGMAGKRFGYRTVIRFALGCNVFVGTLLPLSLYADGALRSTMIITGYAVYSIFTTLIAVNGVPYLAGAVDEGDRGSILAANTAAAPAAGFLGSLAGGVFPRIFANLLRQPMDAPEPYGLPLWIVPVLYAVMFVAFSFTSKEDDHGGMPENTPTAAKPPYSVIALIFTFLVFRIALNHGLLTYFNVYMDVGFGASTALIGAILAVSRALSAPASFVAPVLMKRFGRRGTVLLAGIAAVIAALPLSLIPRIAAAGISIVAVLGINSIFEAAFTTFHQERVAPQWRSLTSGAVFTAAGFSYALVAIVGGVLVEGMGFRAFFLLMNGASLLGMGLFLVFFGVRGRRHA